MSVNHRTLKVSTLLRCQFYKVYGEIELHAVSGFTLKRVTSIATVIISVDEYNDRDFDYYDEKVEFYWAMKKLGVEFESSYEWHSE